MVPSTSPKEMLPFALEVNLVRLSVIVEWGTIWISLLTTTSLMKRFEAEEIVKEEGGVVIPISFEKVTTPPLPAITERLCRVPDLEFTKPVKVMSAPPLAASSFVESTITELVPRTVSAVMSTSAPAVMIPEVLNVPAVTVTAPSGILNPDGPKSISKVPESNVKLCPPDPDPDPDPSKSASPRLIGPSVVVRLVSLCKVMIARSLISMESTAIPPPEILALLLVPVTVRD